MKTPTSTEFMSLGWEKIQPFYQGLQDIELTEGYLEAWMEQWSDLRKLVDETYARLSLAVNLDTED